MLIKTITYTDFDGAQRTEKHHFNFTKAEMIDYETMYKKDGGVIKYLTFLVENEKEYELMQAFKELILRSYGERTANGRFIKNQEIRDAFAASEAYSELFMEVCSSQKAATDFINGLFSAIPEVKKALEDGTIKMDEAGNVVPIPDLG